MRNNIELASIPAGSTIRVGVPAERPEQAIDALRKLFAEKDNVVSARLGLMEIVYPDGNSVFTYTIGIDCAQDELSTIQQAVATLTTVPEGRWPISVVPSTNQYFSADAIVFFKRNRKSPLRRFFRKN